MIEMAACNHQRARIGDRDPSKSIALAFSAASRMDFIRGAPGTMSLGGFGASDPAIESMATTSARVLAPYLMAVCLVSGHGRLTLGFSVEGISKPKTKPHLEDLNSSG